MRLRASFVAASIALGILAVALTASAQTPAPAKAIGSGVTAKAYSAGSGDLQTISAQLQSALSKVDGSVEVYVEAKQNKIIVRGTAAAHNRAATLLSTASAKALAQKTPAGKTLPSNANTSNANTSTKPLPRLPRAKLGTPPRPNQFDENVQPASYDEPIPSQLKLRHTTPDQLCQRIKTTMGAAANVSSRNRGTIEVSLRINGTLTPGITLDEASRIVQLPTNPKHKRFWWQAVQAIDGNKEDGDESTVIKLNKADPAKVKRAVEALQAAIRRRQIEEGLEGNEEELTEEEKMAIEEAKGRQPPPDENGPPQGEGAIGQVQIEVLEGLDSIIIRGPKAAVERVLKIIQDIEKQTQETKPDIEIVPLNHVQDRALADYINQIYTDIYGTRQGRVTILPLKRPNAILLAGKAENIATAKELIAKLDQPNNVDAQFKVFRLKNISAGDAETTIKGFINGTPGGATTGAPAPQAQGTLNGLENRAIIVSDSRINALLVFAGPRDLAELEKLIEQIDVKDLKSANQIRFFRLRNALADDVKATLDAAINTQVSGRAATAGQPAAPGQPGQPAANAGGANATGNRGSGLQFLQVDDEGQRIINSGVLNDVKISSDPKSNSLIITGPSNTMELLEALIDQLDTLAQVDAAIKVFTVVNGDAAALRDTLQQLFGQTTQGAGAQANAVAIATPGAEESTLVSLRFGVDERTNSVIVTGASRDLDTVERILIRLDESDVRRRRTTVYRLRNAPAEDVAAALQEFVQNQRQLNQLAPTVLSPVEQIDREVLVVAEPVSNSLLVSATQRYYEEIRGMIDELDRRPPMVVVQTLIAEVSLGENNEFGVELGLQDALLFRRGINGTTATPGFGFNNQPLPSTNATTQALQSAGTVGAQGLGNFAMGRTNSTLGYGGLVLSASSQSVSALVRALQQNKQLQVISRPQIQTLDNQLGRVQVGASVPYPTNVQTTTIGTSTGITLTDVGIILEVRPRTSPDGLVVMEVGAEKSQLGAEADGIAISVTANGTIRAPQILRTRAVTVVSARTGQTVILGGLITKSRENETRRVPYLSDIPILGNLFRYDRAVEGKTELLVFLTPYIVRNDEDIDFINAQEAARMNWCLSDVADAHGHVPGMGGEGPWGQQSTPVIFPDEDPTGMKTMPIQPQGDESLAPGVPLNSGARNRSRAPLIGQPANGGTVTQMGPIAPRVPDSYPRTTTAPRTATSTARQGIERFGYSDEQR